MVSSSFFAMNHPSLIYTPSQNTHLFSVACCKDKIFIAGADGVHIYHNYTKTISTLSDKPAFHTALHPRTMDLAISNDTELAVYNTNTQEKKWHTQRSLYLWKTTSIVFSSIDDTVCSYKKGTFSLHSSKKLPLHQFSVPYNVRNTAYCVQISCHPHKKEFLYPSGKQTISIVEPNRFHETKETITSPQSDHILHALYNPNATVIAMNDTHGQCYLYDVTTNAGELLQHSLSSIPSHYISMVFHPHDNILALLTDNNSIHYWNYKTKQIIAITNSYIDENESTETTHFSRTKRLDFSPDGKFLAVAFSHACHKLPTPLNNLLMMYCLLRNHLPHDIIKIITHLIPQILELENLNFFEFLKI